ncbi:MAG: sugar ABC transporter permease [Bacteroidota bacterium]
MIVILIAMWAFFRVVVGEFYTGGESIAKLTRDMASWTILAAGMTLIIISGNIDLSVGSLLALVAAACALLMSPEYGPGLPPHVAVPIGLAVGLLLGLLQGALTAYLRIPSFIVTLGGLFVFRGITQKLSEFDPRLPGGTWVVSLGFDYLSPGAGLALALVASGVIALALLRGRAARKKSGLPRHSLVLTIALIAGGAALLVGLTARMNEYRGVPNQTVLMAVILVLLGIVSRRTVFGRHLYAIGGNMEAARLSGIRVERTIVAAYALMGLLAAVAGVVWMAQNQGSTKNAGTYYELYAIAAAVIGGTSMMGGRGTIMGTFLGGLVMATVIQGMDYTNLENWLQLVVRGGVLVLAVGLDMMSKRERRWRHFLSRGSRTGPTLHENPLS